MKRFDKVKEILDRAVTDKPAVGPPHGPFWRVPTRDELVNKKILGNIAVITLNDPEQSMLIRALEGRSPFGLNLPVPPDGSDKPRMPAFLESVPCSEIDFIRKWIADGCPDDEIPDQ